MFVHRFADLTISSPVPLTELPPARPGRREETDLTFGLVTVPPPEPGVDQWAHHWRGGGEVATLSLARQGGELLLRFPGMADFTVSADGKRIGAWYDPKTSADTIRHLLLDQVLPRVLAHLGRLVLHASAVRLGRRCVAFLGASGAGKSTLASSFHATDSSLLADDGLVLSLGDDGVGAIPTYLGLRLWPDTVSGVFPEAPTAVPMAQYSAKRRLIMQDGPEAANVPIPLAALYVLTPGTGPGNHAVSMARLSVRDACMAIVANSFQMDVTDRGRAAGAFAAAGNIAERIPAFELSYPRDFSFLPAVRSVIATHEAT